MHRIVSSLLILLVLVSQSFCAAHSHVGTSIVEPEGHSTRSHVHLNCGKHSHREHDDFCEKSLAIPSEHGPVDHDSDALYVPETTLLNNAYPVKLTKVELFIACEIYDESILITESRFGLENHLPPPPNGLKCPLYLQTLSIRC